MFFPMGNQVWPYQQIKKTHSELCNQLEYCDWFNRLYSLAITMFKWEGLPDTVDEMFLENILFYYGYCLFFEDPSVGFMTLPCNLGPGFNPYYEYVDRYAYSVNYPTKKYTIDNSVVIRNLYSYYPTVSTISIYAQKLAEISRTTSVNVNAQKTPVLITCSEKSRLSLENVYKQYTGNHPVIFADKNLSLDAFQALKTDAPFVADKLMQLKFELLNEIRTFLGINNSNTNKKERLITDEVNSNNQEIMAQREALLLQRKIACDKINNMFGLNISCEFRIKDQDFTNPLDDNINEGDDNE